MIAEKLEVILSKATKGRWWVEVDTSAAQVTGYPVIEAEGYTVVGNEGMYGDIDVDFANASLMALSPALARIVIAAEKMVAALVSEETCCGWSVELSKAISEYQEIDKDSLMLETLSEPIGAIGHPVDEARIRDLKTEEVVCHPMSPAQI